MQGHGTRMRVRTANVALHSLHLKLHPLQGCQQIGLIINRILRLQGMHGMVGPTNLAPDSVISSHRAESHIGD